MKKCSTRCIDQTRGASQLGTGFVSGSESFIRFFVMYECKVLLCNRRPNLIFQDAFCLQCQRHKTLNKLDQFLIHLMNVSSPDPTRPKREPLKGRWFINSMEKPADYLVPLFQNENKHRLKTTRVICSLQLKLDQAETLSSFYYGRAWVEDYRWPPVILARQCRESTPSAAL